MRYAILLIAALALVSAATPAVAQPATNSTGQDRTPIPTPPPGSKWADTPTPTPQENVTGERIDGGLILLSSSYNEDAGTATLTFRATEPTAVTLVDAGGFRRGGVLRDRSLIVQPGETTVEFPVTKVDGMVGVSITTDEVVYAEPIVVEGDGLETPRNLQWLALATGGLLVGLITWLGDIYLTRRQQEGVSRVDG